MIRDETLNAIRDRLSIVDVVSNYVSLRKTGRNHLGLCPFHTEKTPSFTVSEDRGLFHCFGCGAGGSMFTFVMRIENVEFPAAVRLLAERAGVDVPAENAGASEEQRERDRLVWLNDAAQKRLVAAGASDAGSPGREYCARRGLSSAVIEAYGIGFCPRHGSGLVNAISAKAEALQAAARLGLLGQRSDGKYFERMWGRLTFPIRDTSGKIVGFGGRSIDAEQVPKYLNSPESPLFHKGHVLYGLYEARAKIRGTGRIVLVEGYLDAIALAQAGIEDAVATLGTALTATQLRLARRFAPKIVVFFDGDRAGRQAALRAFETCVEAGVLALGAFLPSGQDPDDFVRRQGAVATEQLLDQAVGLGEFYIDSLKPAPGASMQEQVTAVERLMGTLSRVKSPVELALFVQYASKAFDLDVSLFTRNAGRSPARTVPPSTVPPPSSSAPLRSEEKLLFEMALLDRDCAAEIAESAALTLFECQVLADAIRATAAAWRDGISVQAVLDTLPVDVAGTVAQGLLNPVDMTAAERRRIVVDCCGRVERRARDAEVRRIRQQLRDAEQGGNQAEAMRWTQESARIHARSRRDPTASKRDEEP